ncbi:MAG TPA: VanW family protein [Gaiellaceae bacterium]|nr:VanW family protein [Gaiellaceae bacterium]
MRLLWQWSLFLAAVLVLGATTLGLAFAGSPKRLPAGSEIAGVDVSGLTPGTARAMLKRRSRELGAVPVVFTANGKRWRVKPDAVVAEVDWAAAVEAARQQGEGFGPFRGLKRLGVRVFGGDVAPRANVYQSAINSYLTGFAKAVDRPRVEPSLRLRGLQPEVVPGHAGTVLDRREAQRVFVRGLTGLSRDPIALPLRADRPHLATIDLAGAKVKAETALSASVDLSYGAGSWHLTRVKIARLLALPRNGSTELELAGPVATHFFANLRKRVEHPPRDATFRVGAGNIVRVVPAEAGRTLDVEATTRNLLAAMLSTSNRRADLRTIAAAPDRTTREARAMGITGLVGAYETFYGGVPNRIHNVQLVSHLIDNHFIAPGAEFSFNGTTGERTPDKGFLEAPVIINGELKTGLGGGICQVSTTTFNAAYEAGLPITDRTNHALYISHYPLGRDATVNYPDTDLKFVNDTDHWLWLRTFVGSSSLTVALYGTPQHRRIVSDVSPLVVTGAPPVKRVRDPNLLVGQTSLEESGSPSLSTNVRRRVYTAGGKLLYDHTWYSSYRAEPRVIRVGTKPKPEPPAKKKKKGAPPPPPPPGPPPPTSPPTP